MIIKKYTFFIILLLLAQSCEMNPASGKREFSILSKSEENKIGVTEHEKIIKQFGIYENRKLQNYVNSLG